MFQLYYYPDNASLAPHFLLAETGADYELILVDRSQDGQKSESYLKLNPAGRIPTLVDEGRALFESTAICLHICERDPLARFIPAMGHPDRPHFHQWMAYLTNTLQAEFMVWRYPERHTTDAGGAPAIQAAQDTRLVAILALLDREIGAKTYLLGETIYACDHYLYMLLLWCGRFSRPAREFENLRRFMRVMAARPAVARVCAFEEIDITADL